MHIAYHRTRLRVVKIEDLISCFMCDVYQERGAKLRWTLMSVETSLEVWAMQPDRLVCNFQFKTCGRSITMVISNQVCEYACFLHIICKAEGTMFSQLRRPPKVLEPGSTDLGALSNTNISMSPIPGQTDRTEVDGLRYAV